MEISQLEVFRALAEELHFTRAAQRVHCVQSNVPTQVQALEDELGAPLFDRLSKRATVTDAGRRFLPCAEIVLSTILQARTIAASDSTPLGILRIGSSESLFTYRLPRVLSEFRKRYPAVELSFAFFLHDGLLHSIDSGRLDLAIYMVAALGMTELNRGGCGLRRCCSLLGQRICWRQKEGCNPLISRPKRSSSPNPAVPIAGCWSRCSPR